MRRTGLFFSILRFHIPTSANRQVRQKRLSAVFYRPNQQYAKYLDRKSGEVSPSPSNLSAPIQVLLPPVLVHHLQKRYKNHWLLPVLVRFALWGYIHRYGHTDIDSA